jgi:hypothetical protein
VIFIEPLAGVARRQQVLSAHLQLVTTPSLFFSASAT